MQDFCTAHGTHPDERFELKSYVVKLKLTEKELKILGITPERADFNEAVREAILKCINSKPKDKDE